MEIDPTCWQSFWAHPDEDTFGPLYEQSKRLVWTLCWRILREEEETHDAFQDVYARLLAEARRPSRRPGPPADDFTGTMIYRSAILEARRLRDRRRRRGRREIMMEQPPVVADPRPSAFEAAAREQRRARLETLVAMLPEKHRLPIELH
jgi:RNA polymerase sigma factor (sigma-70 family)